MASITAALYITLYHEEKSAIYHSFKFLNSTTEFTSSEAAVKLLHLSRDFAQKLHLDPQTENFSKIFQCLKNGKVKLETKKELCCRSQIVVFDENSGNLLEMIPETFDESLRPLFLLGQQEKASFVLTAVVTNVAEYFKNNKFSFFCLFCKNRFSGKGTKHRCRKRRSCFACHRYMLTKSTYTGT